MALNENMEPERKIANVGTYPKILYVQLTTYHSVVHTYDYSHRSDSRNVRDYNHNDKKINTNKIYAFKHTACDQVLTYRDMSYNHSTDTDIGQAIVMTCHIHNFLLLRQTFTLE